MISLEELKQKVQNCGTLWFQQTAVNANEIEVDLYHSLEFKYLSLGSNNVPQSVINNVAQYAIDGTTEYGSSIGPGLIECIEELEESIHTRRAVLLIPGACNTMFQFFCNDDKYLNLAITFRSSNIDWLNSDLQRAKLMLEYVAIVINKSPNMLFLNFNNIHSGNKARYENI